jgi:hypothetical protein
MSHLRDALVLLAYFFLLCLAAGAVWAWGQIGAPWEIKIAGYVAGFFGLTGFVFLSVEKTLRLFRAMRTQWRMTFPRRRH